MEKYKNKAVNDIMDGIYDYLIKNYGEIRKEWTAGLLLLADNLDLYFECKKILKKEGLFNSERYAKNPLLSTIKDIHASLVKELTHFGATLYSSTKIGNLSDSADDTEMLKNLIGLDDTDEK